MTDLPLAHTSESPSTVRRFTIAVSALFFANGAIYGNWIPRLPEIKDRLGVGNTGLGVSLLGGGIGGLVGSLAIGMLMSRFGSRRLVQVSYWVLPIAMTMVAFVSRPWMLLVVLSVIGVADVSADVATNAQGVIAQERLKRSIMNRLHGLWSLGFAAGTVIGSVGAGLEVDLRVQVLAVAVALIVVVRWASRWLEPVDPATQTSATTGATWRHAGVVAIALAAAGAAAIALEGMPNEWAALLMRDEFGVATWAGLGTVAFGSGMLIGRFSGDHVQERIGDHRMFLGAMVLIVVGLIVVVVTDVVWLALVGLVVSGVGQSVIFPRLYLLAARIPGVSAGAGLGALMVGLRLGGMATTVSMGSLADVYDLRVALGVIASVAMLLLLVSSAVVVRRVRVQRPAM